MRIKDPITGDTFEIVESESDENMQMRFNEDGGLDPSDPLRDSPKANQRPSYPQDWRSYNLSQQQEKRLFLLLLADVCSRIEQPAYKFGRPTLPRGDMIYAMVFKTYSTFSGRRFTSDMLLAKERGYVSEQPHYNSIFNYFAKEELTPLLTQIVTLTSLPLRTVERDFAVDSTGFGTGQFQRWFSFKHGREISSRKWVKCHAICGTRTNVVTGVKITTAFENDSPHLKELVQNTAEHFNMEEVSADKAYLSRDNIESIDEQGAKPFIPFRSNSQPNKHGILWRKLYYDFVYENEVFMDHYHKRSNIETTFHMVKRKFGDAVRSKTWKAQVNEVLCKIIAHNICITIQEMNERGIFPNYSTMLEKSSE